MKKNSNKWERVFIIVCLGILLFAISGRENADTEMLLESTELQKVYGKWKVVEYLGRGVEYSGIDVNDVDYINQTNEYTKLMQETYLDVVLNIEKDNILFFSAPSEMGYYYNDYSDLFFIYRQPLELEVTPPFMCIEMQLKDTDEMINIINDAEDNVVLEVSGHFFKLEKSNE